MTRSLALLACVLAACGRVGFETSATGGADADTRRCTPPRFIQSTCFDPGPMTLSLGEADAGDFVVVALEYDEINTQVTSLTDTLGTPYTRVIDMPLRTSIQSVELWYGQVPVAGEVAITAELATPGVSGFSMHAMEYAGVDLGEPTSFSMNMGMSDTLIGSMTTSGPASMVIAHGVGTGLVNAAPAWNERSACNGNQVVDLVLDDQGSVDVAFPVPIVVPWVVELFAFRGVCAD